MPILNQLPRDYKFTLGERIISGLYDMLEALIEARYSREKLAKLRAINTALDILRYQTRLLLDFKLLSIRRYKYVGQQFNAIGVELGGWIRQQKPIK